MNEDTIVNTVMIFIVMGVTFISSGIFFESQQIQQKKAYTDSLLSYCESIIGERKASFNNDGLFIGCQTVIK